MMTAPTKGCSSTQRTATFAMLTPLWRSPMTRRTTSSSWKSSQVPQVCRITSRCYVASRVSDQTCWADGEAALRGAGRG